MPSPGDQLRHLSEHKLDDGFLVLDQLPDARLRVSLLAEREGPALYCAVTTRVLKTDWLLVMISWKDLVVTSVFVDNLRVFSSEPGGVEDLDAGRQPRKLPVLQDFSEKGEKARRKRKHKLESWRRERRDVSADEIYAFSSLEGEVNQLRDLVASVSEGKIYHVPGMMSRIRLLLVDRPLGLLQMCAAYLDVPLILYTTVRLDMEPPAGPQYMVLFDASPMPTDGLWNPIDLDTWLSANGLHIRMRPYPHRELIREIGNTVASHRDMDMQQSVVLLMSGRANLTVNMDYLGHYSLMVARVVLSLAEGLLATRKTRRSSRPG